MEKLEKILALSDLYLSGEKSNDEFMRSVAVSIDKTFQGVGQYTLTLDECTHAVYKVDLRGKLGSTYLCFEFSGTCRLKRGELDAAWGPSEKGTGTVEKPWVLYYPDIRKPGFKYRGARIEAEMSGPIDEPASRITAVYVCREWA